MIVKSRNMGPGRAIRKRKSAKTCQVLLCHFPLGARLTVFGGIAVAGTSLGTSANLLEEERFEFMVV